MARLAVAAIRVAKLVTWLGIALLQTFKVKVKVLLLLLVVVGEAIKVPTVQVMVSPPTEPPHATSVADQTTMLETVKLKP